jgi:hypothetical protein
MLDAPPPRSIPSEAQFPRVGITGKRRRAALGAVQLFHLLKEHSMESLSRFLKLCFLVFGISVFAVSLHAHERNRNSGTGVAGAVRQRASGDGNHPAPPLWIALVAFLRASQ